MRFIITELTLVNFTINMDNSSRPSGFVIFPITVIESTIRPVLFSSSMPLFLMPLPNINNSRRNELLMVKKGIYIWA
jgi:hypothetical protein